jgi:hypothetical protein
MSNPASDGATVHFFTDVPRSIDQTAIIGIYELNEVDLMKDACTWAYTARIYNMLR